MRHFVILLAAVASLLAAGPGVAQVPHAQRLQPTAAPPWVWLDEAQQPKPFARYMLDAGEAIRLYHHAPPEGQWPGLDGPLAEAIGPRQWPLVGTDCTARNTEGVLLVHGLTDTPYLMRDIGDALAGAPLAPGRCTLLRSLLLPGHGTAPGDLLNVRYQDWTAAARYGIESFAGEAARVHVVGFSTGGALGLHWAYHQQGESLKLPLASLVLLSPAIQPTGWISRLTFTPRFLSWVSSLTGLMRWTDQHEDRDFAKYESFPLNAGMQIYLLDESLGKLLEQPVPVPMFMALSRHDGTIDSRASIDVFVRQEDPRNRMWLALARTRGSDDAATTRAMQDTRVTLVDVGALPAQYLDFAHTAFPVAPGNTHYRADGFYANCLHYAQDMPEQFQACITPAMRVSMGLPDASTSDVPLVYGETVKGKSAVDGVLLRRLTFNPLFDDMVGRTRAFLASVVAP